MHLPTFPRSMAAVRHVQTAFGGYDHRPACPEGGIYEMINGSAADSPLFATRPGRTLSYPSTGQPNGLFAAGDGLLWCAGTALYHNGEAVPGCTLTDTAKVFAELGGTVLIWPDKIWFRPADGTFGSAEPSWTGTVTLGSSDDTGDAGRANVLQADGAGTRFRTGDAVTLSGFGDARNNGTYILRGIDGAKLIFDPNTFVGSGTVSGVTITRRIPDAQHACSYGNRLWACAQDTVWCTKLGDPLSWFWYEADENGAVATAAWSVDVGAPGDFSGCAATGSGVVFLKPEGLWRLYGTRPDNFQLVASAALGAEQGSGRTLVTAAETLYYLSPAGPARTAADGRRASRHARAHALGRSGGHGRHALVSLGARREKRLAPVRIRHAQRPVEPRGRFSRARLCPARRRALRAGCQRRLALRNRQHGTDAESARDGRLRQRQPGLQAPAARTAAAGGGSGHKHHGGGAV